MIISRTPYRISFFGGGTDYPAWYQNYGGASVFSATINKYCYLTCRHLPPFFSHKSRIVWSEVERVLDHRDILHPVVNAVFRYLNIQEGVEVQHQGDLPARSGLGSSSAFTVGLLHAMYAMLGVMSSKHELACQAVYIEREVLKENVGVQDQIQTAYGGLNKIQIRADGHFDVQPITLPQQRLQLLHSHFMLFFTGVSRTASDIAAEKIKAIPTKEAQLRRMQQMVDESITILSDGHDITDFGRLLDESWQLKRQLSSGVSTNLVDGLYEKAKAAGAIGGKLLGAGGGGFMLLFAKPEQHQQILKALDDLLWVPFDFEYSGSQIIFYDNAPHSHRAGLRRDFLHLREKTDIESQEYLKTSAQLKKLRSLYGTHLNVARSTLED